MIKAVVYDCDGVIVDSKESILAYYNRMMDKCGLPPINWTEDDIRQKAFSMADKDILEVLSAGDKNLYRKMLEISRNDDVTASFDQIILEEGIIEGLEAVKQMGIPMAVFTNRGRSLPLLLEHFGIRDYFSILVTSADVSQPKPSAEGLLKICSYFKITPNEVLFIGDSPTDYQAALSCGAKFAAFKKPLWDAPVICDHRKIADIICG